MLSQIACDDERTTAYKSQVRIQRRRLCNDPRQFRSSSRGQLRRMMKELVVDEVDRSETKGLLNNFHSRFSALLDK